MRTIAAVTAEPWRTGLADWAQDGERIRRLRAAADISIYTPGSEAGKPLSVLRSFAAPAAGVLDDATALKERIAGSVAGLLGLLGIGADPIRSREHILLAAILDGLAQGQKPISPHSSARRRSHLSTRWASSTSARASSPRRTAPSSPCGSMVCWPRPALRPGSTATPLDIQRAASHAGGKPRISIISIAHLNDAERMFVVTFVANELVAWMRRQCGTTSLRASSTWTRSSDILPHGACRHRNRHAHLDEAGAGIWLGVVLATQNPVDLDYKGLGNAGTWFIGRLQTERDKIASSMACSVRRPPGPGQRQTEHR